MPTDPIVNTPTIATPPVPVPVPVFNPATGITINPTIDPFAPIQPGETNTQYMARITQAYKDVPQPTLTPAQSAAGATVQFVRTGAAGVGEYKIVYPIGVPFDPVTGQPTGPNVFSTLNSGSGNGGVGAVAGASNAAGATNAAILNPTGNGAGTTTVGQSAIDVINGFLKNAGMDALSNDVWAKWTAGTTSNQIMDYIRTTPQYAARFPGMAALNAAGRNISEAAYIYKEQSDIEFMKQYGITDPAFLTHDYLGKLIVNNVTTVDLQARLMAAQDTVMSFDPSIVKYAKDVFGLGQGDLMAWALDPTKALPNIQQQAKAMQIGGAAFAAGLKATEITKAEAESLAAAGITQDQAKQGFTNVAQMGQYKQTLPGANPAETLTNEELINAQFATSPDAIMKLQKARQSKLSEYAQGGQFAATQAGVTGIGSAPST